MSKKTETLARLERRMETVQTLQVLTMIIVTFLFVFWCMVSAVQHEDARANTYPLCADAPEYVCISVPEVLQ